MGPTSRRYEGSRQLVELGLITTTQRFVCHVHGRHGG
jgi:hypothetical protein